MFSDNDNVLKWEHIAAFLKKKQQKNSRVISIVVPAHSHKNIPLIDTTSTLPFKTPMNTEEDDTSKNQETNKIHSTRSTHRRVSLVLLYHTVRP